MPIPTTTPAATPAVALAHFPGRLAVETDCADVGAALSAGGGQSFVVLDVRSAEAFARGHLPGAVSLPSAEITAARLDALGLTDLFITYCWGRTATVRPGAQWPWPSWVGRSRR